MQDIGRFPHLNSCLEQGSSADLDHVELLDVVVPQHGGRQLGPEHCVVPRAAQHQVGSVHWNRESGHGRGGSWTNRVNFWVDSSVNCSLKQFGQQGDSCCILCTGWIKIEKGWFMYTRLFLRWYLYFCNHSVKSACWKNAGTHQVCEDVFLVEIVFWSLSLSPVAVLLSLAWPA